MATSAEHYDNHLGPVYVWMAGGVEAALQAGRAEIHALNLPLEPGATVVDLGAGFGMHAIPLARAGAKVTAIDSSAAILRTLDKLRGDVPVLVVNDDLLRFENHIAQAPSAILCMGDTITHLRDHAAVDVLLDRAAAVLRPGGMLVLTFRDYSIPLTGDARFIPVRSDDERTLLCFLEYGADTVIVHDVLSERTGQGWQTRISHYPKLRLSPDDLANRLRSRGFDVRCEAGARGMVRVVAQRV
jgi:SAM-dependent methyltransferase